jgi:hypothetical protein
MKNKRRLYLKEKDLVSWRIPLYNTSFPSPWEIKSKINNLDVRFGDHFPETRMLSIGIVFSIHFPFDF